MSENCDLIIIFQIYGQFGAIRKLNSGRVVCETYIFINSNLLPPHPSTTSKRTPKKPINIRVNQDFPLSRRATDEKSEITLSGLYRDCFYINNFEQILKFCGPVPQCIFVSSCHYRLKIF